ncbi:uncharacterized protein LOC125943506 [Dermacentor silvarum]|uniref:uncharacterized protein LOC125943506 n=1 Tax=Dermacentor silvarum TaxID=543639 RepID=UPI002100FE3F|nr:uncharacterized protein LOC125943506 [Dermacentor silvarum]
MGRPREVRTLEEEAAYREGQRELDRERACRRRADRELRARDAEFNDTAGRPIPKPTSDGKSRLISDQPIPASPSPAGKTVFFKSTDSCFSQPVKNEYVNDDEVDSYWKEPLGWMIEQIGKWLQVKDPIYMYSAEDNLATPEDTTVPPGNVAQS